jgi:hypothetical protein
MPRPVDGFESLHAEDQQRGQVAQILLKSGGSDVIRIQHYWTTDLASQTRNVKPAGYRSHVPPGHSRKIPQRGALDECLVRCWRHAGAPTRTTDRVISDGGVSNVKNHRMRRLPEAVLVFSGVSGRTPRTSRER